MSVGILIGVPEDHSTPGPHNRSAIDRDVRCPLCDYNLRGLIDPRCPECGHRFEWAEVLDPEFEVRWLVEHARRPGERAFAWTVVRALWPWTFWRDVRATHAVRPVRLGGFLFRLVVLQLATVMALSAAWTFSAVRDYADSRARTARAILTQAAREPGTWRQRLDWAAVNDASAFVEKHWPSPSWRMVSSVWAVACSASPVLRWSNSWGAGPHLPNFRSGVLRVPVFGAAWVCLTLAALAIFRVSLRQAGLSWRHVLRLTAYSAAPGVLFVPLVVVFDWTRLWRHVNLPVGWDDVLGLNQLIPLTLYVSFGLMGIALVVGARRYLRIPRGGAMAASALVIVLLLLIQLGAFTHW